MFDESEEIPNVAAIAEVAVRFETMLLKKEQPFFAEDVFLDLTEYYLNLEKLDDALKATKYGLKIYTSSLELLLYKSHVLTEQFLIDDALEVLDIAMLFHPNDTKITYQRALISIITGRSEEAIETLKELEENFEDKDSLYNQLGLLYANLDQNEEALFYLKKACELKTKNVLVYLEMTVLYGEMDLTETGLNYFKKLIDQDPYNYLAWFALGNMYRDQYNSEEAIYALDYAVTIQDDFDLGWFQIGAMYMNTENYTAARDAFIKANAIHEDPEYLTHIAAACENLEDYTDALKYYKKTTELDEFWDEGWFGIGSVLYEQEKYIESIHFVNKAIKINGFKADYYCLLGDAETKLGNTVSADEAYQKAVELDPIVADFWLNWSLLYFDNQDYVQAMEIIEDAISELPEEADLYYRACVYLLYDTQFKKAYDYLQEALILDFDGHEQLYDYFSNLDTLKALQRIIDQYRK
jgi:tetratricopeptide (TPR) repeat protein